MLPDRTWNLRIIGATESADRGPCLCWREVARLPVREVVADFHCVTNFTVPAVCWTGIPRPSCCGCSRPRPPSRTLMVWADFGYSANVRISDFAAEDTLLATHRDGDRSRPSTATRSAWLSPSLYAWKSVKWVRAIEYMTIDRRGFWEERGYHNVADPWREQRYSYQETEGEGPPLLSGRLQRPKPTTMVIVEPCGAWPVGE